MQPELFPGTFGIGMNVVGREESTLFADRAFAQLIDVVPDEIDIACHARKLLGVLVSNSDFECFGATHILYYTWSMDSKQQYRTGRHCVFMMHVHLVFITKYRGRVFESRHLETLEQILTKVCADFECDLAEFNGETDHVHLLVNYPPKVAVSKLVNSLKGASSRRMKRYHPELKQPAYLKN